MLMKMRVLVEVRNVMMLSQPRNEFIARLLSMVKSQPASSPATATATATAEDFDSWEDRLSDEVITPLFADN